jgi:hypothetical protein
METTEAAGGVIARRAVFVCAVAWRWPIPRPRRRTHFLGNRIAATTLWRLETMVRMAQPFTPLWGGPGLRDRVATSPVPSCPSLGRDPPKKYYPVKPLGISWMI